MFKIFRFLTIYSFRKISTYISLIGVALVMIGLIILVADKPSSLPEGTTLVNYPSYLFTGAYSSFSFYLMYSVFAMFYITLKLANIFRDGEQDGTTLLLMSRQIVRREIIIGRFLTLLLHMFIFSFIFGTSCFIGIRIAGYSTNAFNVSLSLFIGSMVVLFLFASICLFFNFIFGKIGAIIVSMLIGIALPILSLILVELGEGRNKGWMESGQIIAIVEKNNGDYDVEKYLSSHAGTDKSEIKYTKYAYFDFWYQIRTPFYWLMPNYSENIEKTEIVENKNITSNDYITVEWLKNYAVWNYELYSNDYDLRQDAINPSWLNSNESKKLQKEHENILKKSIQFFDALPEIETQDGTNSYLTLSNIHNLLSDFYLDPAASDRKYAAEFESAIESDDFSNNIKLSEDDVNQKLSLEWKGEFIWTDSLSTNKQGDQKLTLESFHNTRTFMSILKRVEDESTSPLFAKTLKDALDDRAPWFEDQIGVIQRYDSLPSFNTIEKSPYISPTMRSLFWGFTTIILFSTTIIIFFKQDFK